MHYYQFNLSDYITATAHLTPMQDLAYRRLLDFYYEKESPIPNKTDWVSNRLRLASEVDSVAHVLQEFFTLNDEDMWVHDVCDKNIQAYQKRCVSNKANAIKGGRPKKTQSVSSGNPIVSLTNNHKPLTTNHLTTSPPSRKKSNYTPDDLEFCKYMVSCFKKIVPNFRDPNLESWANTIRLMREVDNREAADIFRIFEWANADPFWQSNILSANKLRKQFDQLGKDSAWTLLECYLFL